MNSGQNRDRGKHARIAVRELSPDEHADWEDFVVGAPSGSVYSLPQYLDVLTTAAGGRGFVLAALRGDTIVGGVAVYERTSPAGRYVAPRLLLYYNGIVLREYPTRYPSERASRHAETVAALAEALERRRYGRLELRQRSPFVDARPLVTRGWRAEPSYTYVVPLDDLEEQWNRVEQNLRRLVSRARERGLELVVDGDFDALFELHAATHRRKGAPLYLDREAFARYYAELRARGLCHLYNARLPDGRVAASQLVLLGHPVTHTVCAATDADLQESGASAFLRWHAFEHLAGLGHAANDLTDAMLAPVARFKAQLGGELHTSLVVSRRRSVVFRAERFGRRAAGRVRRTLRHGRR